MKEKVYLSGPYYLLKDNRKKFDEMSKQCEAYGFECLKMPEALFEHKSSHEEGVECAKRRKALLKEADIIIADCNDLYGSVEPFGETALELGMAYAYGKKLICYTSDIKDCAKRYRGATHLNDEGRVVDENNITFEPQTLNVMLYNPSIVVEGNLEAALKKAREVTDHVY